MGENAAGAPPAGRVPREPEKRRGGTYAEHNAVLSGAGRPIPHAPPGEKEKRPEPRQMDRCGRKISGGRDAGGVHPAGDAGGDGPDAHRLALPGAGHLPVRHVGGRVYAPVHRPQLDGEADGLRRGGSGVDRKEPPAGAAAVAGGPHFSGPAGDERALLFPQAALRGRAAGGGRAGRQAAAGGPFAGTADCGAPGGPCRAVGRRARDPLYGHRRPLRRRRDGGAAGAVSCRAGGPAPAHGVRRDAGRAVLRRGGVPEDGAGEYVRPILSAPAGGLGPGDRDAERPDGAGGAAAPAAAGAGAGGCGGRKSGQRAHFEAAGL